MRHANRIIVMALGIAAASTVWAGPRPQNVQPYEYYDQARVISSTPIHEEFNEPREQCWVERVSYEVPYSHSYGGAIVGGIVGGVLGNQVGKGTGKTVATAVGAATGAIIGDKVDNKGRPTGTQTQTRDEERCRLVDNWSKRITGYKVIYRFQGHDYSTILPHDPGAHLRLKVAISVDERW
jgi:uncharacterized protein YcfJ